MIRAALIGVGYWGPNLLRNLVAHREIEMKWVCDLDDRRLGEIAQRYPHIKTTRHHSDLLRDASVDLIVIATPVQSHFPLAMASLRAGKNVLLTKPMAPTETGCLALIEQADREKKILMVDHTYVYHPAVAAIKQMVAGQQLGDLLYYHSSRMNLGLYQPDVSVIYDLMPHDLSILMELVPSDPIEISVSSKNVARFPQPDVAFMHLNYQSDFIATIQVSWLSPSKIRQTIVTGRKKMVLYDDMDVLQKLRVFDKGVDAVEAFDKQLAYTQFIKYRQGDIYSPAIAETEALKVEIEHVVDCISRGATPRTDGIQGLRVVRILEQADRLARSNRCWMPLKLSGLGSSAAADVPVPRPRRRRDAGL